MKTLTLITVIILGYTLTIAGQNYMGMNQSKIKLSIGDPDLIGHNYFVYNDLIEDGENIYYFDENGNCNSFKIVRNISYLGEYQKMLKKEFKEAGQNKYIKKTKKIYYLAELTQWENTFQIKVEDSNIIPDNYNYTMVIQ
jgi:hypothetical protein